MRFLVAALIAPLHDPLRLAEDMVVLDNLSPGRIDLVVAGCYVPEEFAMFGAPMTERGKRVTEVVATLKAAFTGEPFEYRGRRVQVTPAPYRPGGPSISLGGSSEPATMFHPLCGGMPPGLAWSSLHLLEQEVLTAFA